MEETNFLFDFGVRRESVFLYMAYSSNQIYIVYMSYPVSHPTLFPTNEFLAVVCVRRHKNISVQRSQRHICALRTNSIDNKR